MICATMREEGRCGAEAAVQVGQPLCVALGISYPEQGLEGERRIKQECGECIIEIAPSSRSQAIW